MRSFILVCSIPLLALPSGPLWGQHAAELDPIVVTARRLADQVLQHQVQLALEENRYFLADHLNIEVRNGVVTLTGQVFDEWDLRIALREARRVAGVRRVVNALEFIQGGE
jgi:osmotically-inducible protein OsmY